MSSRRGRTGRAPEPESNDDSGPWRVASFHTWHVLDDGSSFALRTAGIRFDGASERVGDAGNGAGATRRGERNEPIEEVGGRYARLEPVTDPSPVFEHLLVGIADDGGRHAHRGKRVAGFQADDERERDRQEPDGDVRKEDRAALHDVADGVTRPKHEDLGGQAKTRKKVRKIGATMASRGPTHVTTAAPAAVVGRRTR